MFQLNCGISWYIYVYPIVIPNGWWMGCYRMVYDWVYDVRVDSELTKSYQISPRFKGSLPGRARGAPEVPAPGVCRCANMPGISPLDPPGAASHQRICRSWHPCWRLKIPHEVGNLQIDANDVEHISYYSEQLGMLHMLQTSVIYSIDVFLLHPTYETCFFDNEELGVPPNRPFIFCIWSQDRKLYVEWLVLIGDISCVSSNAISCYFYLSIYLSIYLYTCNSCT